jgi:hypothetical protein
VPKKKKFVTVMSATAPPEPMLEQAIRQRAYELYINAAWLLDIRLMIGYRPKPSYTATPRPIPIC